MRKTLLILGMMCAVVVSVGGQAARTPKPPFTAQDVENGMRLAKLSFDVRNQMTSFANGEEPFKIAGNLYFVGVGNGESYLLTSPQGHILMGAAFGRSGAAVAKNIETLGFKLTDVKAILLNHYHGDQTGATAYLKERTGAQVMAGFGDVPYIERPNTITPASVPAPKGAAPASEPRSPFAGFAPRRLIEEVRGDPPQKPVKVDRALYDGDVVNVGPLKVTVYLTPGHSPTPASWFFTVRDGGREYRVLEWCCWELPDDYSRSPYLSEATMRHSFDNLRKLLPIDIYLETGAYGWSGILGQPSGTFDERMARLKRDPKLWINRDIFRQLMAAREADFEERLAAMRSKTGSQ